MADSRVEVVWHDGPVPAGLPVLQVYGWLLCPSTVRPAAATRTEPMSALSASSTGAAHHALAEETA
jgi:hypothetical protein